MLDPQYGEEMGSPTSNGNQLCHSAQDNIMSKNPTARTNERRMTAARVKSVCVHR